jgi:SWI/SNF related-matrix-associated actin-dependent regulator of chromatin subfamily C
VASRTREECVLKFLQLEIGDNYLEVDPLSSSNVNAGSGTTGDKMLPHLAGGRIPFSQVDNPVLSTMSYLVGLADPATTAAVSGKAVEEVRKTMRARLEKTSSGDKGKEKEGAAPSSGGAVKAEGETGMDVDDNAVALRDNTKPNPSTTLPFALSAARAAGLASHEERTLTRLIHTATNLQTEKLELKMQQFAELESMIAAERRDLERRRQQLFLARLAFQRKVREVEAVFTRACSLTEPREGMKLVREALGGGEETLVVEKVGSAGGGEVLPVEGKSFEI